MSIFSRVSDKCKVNISENVVIQENVVVSPKCESISIGFGSFLGRDIYIDSTDVVIGDYTTIHHGSIIQGEQVCIGHNCWFGHYTIIDGTGICKIGNNVGVGAHSQLWSHMKFGDVLNGCRFNSQGPLIVEDDVWLVGHSLVGPITAKTKSMLLTGSFATKDMEENRVYWGTPAILMEKMRGQFRERKASDKANDLEKLIAKFKAEYGIPGFQYKILLGEGFKKSDCEQGVLQFDVERRMYMPTRSIIELQFIKFMLYDKAKFLPCLSE